MMDDKLIYVYCAAGHKPAFSNVTDAESLLVFHSGDLFAVARYVSTDDFSEENLKKNFGNLAWVEMQTREHIRVISLVMEQGTVVPFKFGTIFTSTESLECFFNEYQKALSENLLSLNGNEEWAVKLYCNSQLFQEHIKVASEEIKALENEMHLSKPGRAFILKQKLATLLKEETHRQLGYYGQTFYEYINELSCKTLINPLLPKEVTERSDDMVLNLACLIHKSNVKALIDKIDVLRKKYSQTGLMPELSGPWPPFGFVAIK